MAATSLEVERGSRRPRGRARTRAPTPPLGLELPLRLAPLLPLSLFFPVLLLIFLLSFFPHVLSNIVLPNFFVLGLILCDPIFIKMLVLFLADPPTQTWPR